MSDASSATAPAAEAVLRALARRANGLSGADIERLIREARQAARRQRRGVTWSDLDGWLSVSKPPRPKALRWRMALHEAGHAVARIVLKLGTITLITIDGSDGGFVESTEPPHVEETEALLSALLLVKLAGRATEEILLGSCIAGSGGGPESDLASATALALQMEVSLGYDADQPLLYRNADENASLLIYRPEIARRVNARLEQSYADAKGLISTHRAAVEGLARVLITRDTLEGKYLDEVLALLSGSIRHGDDTLKSDEHASGSARAGERVATTSRGCRGAR